MSIISDALKKANADRMPESSDKPLLKRSGSGSGAWGIAFFAIALVIAPFFIPRYLPHARSSSLQVRSALPLADAPGARIIPSTGGLAQVSVESASLPGAAQNAFNLQGTVWTQGRGRYAILNKRVVREGGMVGDFRVTRIDDRSVTLTSGSQELTVSQSV
jgi:hypothetical protein